MELRLLGKSGLKVSALSFGTMTFGGGEFFEHMGVTQVDEARQSIDVCTNMGANAISRPGRSRSSLLYLSTTVSHS